ncbi:MAG TPA: DUF2252 family protein [Puia sp.]|nr:DUF2252 family protein [Puia sp.]
MASTPHRIRDFNNDRLPEYVAIKYQMMAENAFRFLRGTCHLYYEDLQASDALPQYPLSWICGDLHLENFGTYKGDNRLVYFDVNDFDEGILAPALWEVSRMVTSIHIGLDSLGIKKKEAVRVAGIFLRLYADTLVLGKHRYIEPRTANGIVQTFLDKVCERKQKDLIRQRTEGKGGRLVLRIDRIRFFPLDKALRKELMAHMQEWIQTDPLLRRRYEVVDCAFRVAGTGSLGIRRYVFLARQVKNPSKYLLIDMKQALPSCIRAYVNITQPAWASEAARVIAIQQRMQNICPALLGATHFKGVDYVVKELQPTVDRIDFMLLRDRYKDLECVIEDMAVLTASIQLRSAGRQGAAIPDELIAFGGDHHWQKGVMDYAAAYSEQVKKDYKEYFIAYKDGYFK